VRNVLIVTPGSTIQRKTIDNLTPGHPKYLRGMQSRPMVITLDTVERGEVGAALADPDRFKVFVFTVQSLLRPNKEDRRRAFQPHETLGTAVRTYLEQADDLVVIADEHHVYYSGSAKKFEAAITELHPLATIGLTATPHAASESMVVYRYPLSEAIADGWVKIPVLVTRQDGIHDVRTQLADGLTLLDAKRDAMRAYCAQVRGRKFAEPVMFLVATTIEEATEYRDLLVGSDMLGSSEQVLLVTSEEPDATLGGCWIGWRTRTRRCGRWCRCRCSRKGGTSRTSTSSPRCGRWSRPAHRADPRSRAAAAVRAAHRQPDARHRRGALAPVVRVAAQAGEVLLEQTLGDRVDEASVVVNPVAGRFHVGTEVGASGEFSGTSSRRRGRSRSTCPVGCPDPTRGLFDVDEDVDAEAGARHTGFMVSTMDARVAAGALSAETALASRLRPRTPGGVKIPLFLPSVVTRWERDPFTLASINLDSVEALGRTFARTTRPP
jgi:type III restriction enzyme